MNIVVFLLLMAVCIGFIYLVHKYFGKNEFYLLTIIYSVLSFLMSFKLINIFGVNINSSIIFSSGILMILYYFINRYGNKEKKKFIMTVFISTFICGCFLMLSSFMIPSLYDTNSFYQNMILDNLAIVIIYPISLIITLLLCSYSFEQLKLENKNKHIKMILTIIGIMFIDNFIFIYFSYAILVRFDIAMGIALENYLFKTLIMVIYIFVIEKIFEIRKVK